MKHIQILGQIFFLKLQFYEHCQNYNSSFLFTMQAELEI